MKSKLAALRQDIWLELNDNLTAFEKVRVFNYIFFQVHGYRGNKRNYHAPQNSYIQRGAGQQEGQSASLAIIYQVPPRNWTCPARSEPAEPLRAGLDGHHRCKPRPARAQGRAFSM